MRPDEGGLTYRAAGVDVARKAGAIARLSAHTRRTHRPGVLGDIGGFGGLFALDVSRYPEPVLVSSADGVGTKLKVAQAAGRHDTVGIDLVAMNVDDVAVQGAEPLFFLDYVAMGSLDEATLDALVRGVAEGCRQAGCALVGGETAEMPDFYAPGEYDLAGFCVGVVNRDRLLDGRDVRPGHAVVGLASSGLHSNGYSLARRVLLRPWGGAFDLDDRPPELGGRTVAEELLVPTRIYAPALLALRGRVRLAAAAHITGGSFAKNLPRVLPAGLGVELRRGTWPEPPVFGLIQRLGRVAPEEMERTFNLGIGMAIIVPPEDAEAAVAALAELGLAAWRIGTVTDRPGVVIRR
ncbi:phosphoribosylformylglycinamidine cyclo-ligase [Caldinitratiruptor microaerophilus]|uniref:Phosphoribosylformylglycinamidine cyclo-ligase n=1 Tax=Caldinitratiruptor microaerophilus TaxID=671077 RepID=A0AA35G8P4_9FIRM|nr:phosphoribosylformylglycinamidine cyclo-ligase [Caldinitratiruptor microaerophilus]BDG61281.1 phosphoribosylformylglycinamidine cyclo-ligase [Caldinitratiruptor microaerophilus]